MCHLQRKFEGPLSISGRNGKERDTNLKSQKGGIQLHIQPPCSVLSVFGKKGKKKIEQLVFQIQLA